MKGRSTKFNDVIIYVLCLSIMVISSISLAGCSNAVEVPNTYPKVATYVLFGRNIPAGGEVSDQQFNDFLDNVITPAFPSGLTVFDAYGQWRNQDGSKVQQKTKVLWIVGNGSKADSDAIHKIVKTYRERFGGAGVLIQTSPATAEFFAN